MLKCLPEVIPNVRAGKEFRKLDPSTHDVATFPARLFSLEAFGHTLPEEESNHE